MITNDIIVSAAKRDSEAFRQIYMEFRDFVWNISITVTSNKTHAEDIASEVFLKLFKNIKKFKFKSSFRSWLYRITINTALNYIDKEKRRQTKHLNEDYKDKEHRMPDPENEIYEKTLTNRLLGKLDAKQRLLLVLREIEGLSYSDISQMLLMNIGTVKTNIYRARDKLREIYKEERR